MNDPSISPRVGRDVFVASTAYVGGDVVLGDEVTVMHHVVIRGDVASIRIGHRVNVQDGTILHTPHGKAFCHNSVVATSYEVTSLQPVAVNVARHVPGSTDCGYPAGGPCTPHPVSNAAATAG